MAKLPPKEASRTKQPKGIGHANVKSSTTSDRRPHARKKQILARAAALSSQREGIRCEHVKELIHDAVACKLDIESEIFQVAYGDPEGREYWNAHLSEPLSVEAFAELLSAHLGQDMEESQSALIAAVGGRFELRPLLPDTGVVPRAAVQWLLSLPKRAHLVPRTLRAVLARESNSSAGNTRTSERVSSFAGKRGRKPETLNRVQQAMWRDIQSGRLTEASLESMLEKNLAEQYGVSRDTARKARAAVLSKNVENSK